LEDFVLDDAAVDDDDGDELTITSLGQLP